MISISDPGETVNENSAQFSGHDTSYRTNRQILADALASIEAIENERCMLEVSIHALTKGNGTPFLLALPLLLFQFTPRGEGDAGRADQQQGFGLSIHAPL